jgi:hypothetical protein
MIKNRVSIFDQIKSEYEDDETDQSGDDEVNFPTTLSKRTRRKPYSYREEEIDTDLFMSDDDNSHSSPDYSMSDNEADRDNEFHPPIVQAKRSKRNSNCKQTQQKSGKTGMSSSMVSKRTKQSRRCKDTGTSSQARERDASVSDNEAGFRCRPPKTRRKQDIKQEVDSTTPHRDKNNNIEIINLLDSDSENAVDAAASSSLVFGGLHRKPASLSDTEASLSLA